MNQLQEPWLNEGDFANRIEREISKHSHVLSGIETKSIARRLDNDDVLFRLLDGTDRVAVVHLTYGRPKPDKSNDCPLTTIYETLR